MKQQILSRLMEVATKLGIDESSFNIDYPDNPEHGDFSTNIALVNSKKLGVSPRELSEKIITEFKKSSPADVKKIEVAGPGFINFFVEVPALQYSEENFGRSTQDTGKKIMVEYTDPNPFKVVHIGHLMSNAIGESISRLVQYTGAEIKRANWQGDVGPHVAKALWGAEHVVKNDESAVSFWGKAYVAGSEAYEKDGKEKKEIEDINKKVYDRSDDKINALYDSGRRECLEAFEKIYKRLDTKFDNYFFESIEGRQGESIVKEFLEKGIFEKSDGAIVFKGEKYGLHTRVFMTSHGLPTYETKELGLNKEKFKIYPDLAQSIIVTANEQSDYFRVLLKVMDLVYPEIAKKTKHISHGMLRFADGKMSSRKGNVISAESLIEDIKKLVINKIDDRGFSESEAEEISDIIAVGAIKYTILRQSIGGDVIFDSAASVSFEGDSGPYLQYSAVRAGAILKKAEVEGVDSEFKITDSQKEKLSDKVVTLVKMIDRFSDIILRARNEYSPQHVSSYLINLAGIFNSFYASQTIVDKNDELSPYYVALTKSFQTVMTNGLWVLGIKVPSKM